MHMSINLDTVELFIIIAISISYDNALFANIQKLKVKKNVSVDRGSIVSRECSCKPFETPKINVVVYNSTSDVRR